MTIRKTIFWTHLAAGVVSALVVVMMSFTGVLLTYERQIKEWADRQEYDFSDESADRLSVDDLLAVVRQNQPDLEFRTLTILARPDAAPYFAAGRSDRSYVDPANGHSLGSGNASVRAFFGVLMRWHRWFDLSADARKSGRAITGAANLMFLFLIVSGIYLWLPPIWRWAAIRPRLRFNEKVNTSKARDYNWHHVFGFWTLLPLFFIVLSGVTISYSWAKNSVYALAGEDPPSRGGGSVTALLSDAAKPLPLQSHFEYAAATSPAWQRISVSLPSASAATVSIAVDEGTGGEPTLKKTLILDRVTGDEVKVASFADRTPAGKVLGYFRWLHTGEALGLAGQTIAGIVSALSLLMVWTGLALAYRRLIQPLFRTRMTHSKGN